MFYKRKAIGQTLLFTGVGKTPKIKTFLLACICAKLGAMIKVLLCFKFQDCISRTVKKRVFVELTVSPFRKINNVSFFRRFTHEIKNPDSRNFPPSCDSKHHHLIVLN